MYRNKGRKLFKMHIFVKWEWKCIYKYIFWVEILKKQFSCTLVQVQCDLECPVFGNPEIQFGIKVIFPIHLFFTLQHRGEKK